MFVLVSHLLENGNVRGVYNELAALLYIFQTAAVLEVSVSHLFVVGGLHTLILFTRIARLTRVFILLVGSPKSDRLKDRGHTG